MKPGPSSEITKAVIEVFAPRFMEEPAILFVSESGNKVVSRDDDLAKSIGLTIKADKDFPTLSSSTWRPNIPFWCLLRSWQPMALLMPGGKKPWRTWRTTRAFRWSMSPS
nr:BsuBI/PstI family type II restriction endonuclease [Mesorhizobium amorphae]